MLGAPRGTQALGRVDGGHVGPVPPGGDAITVQPGCCRSCGEEVHGDAPCLPRPAPETRTLPGGPCNCLPEPLDGWQTCSVCGVSQRARQAVLRLLRPPLAARRGQLIGALSPGHPPVPGHADAPVLRDATPWGRCIQDRGVVVRGAGLPARARWDVPTRCPRWRAPRRHRRARARRGAGGREAHQPPDFGSPANSLARVPWLCVPGSPRVCLCRPASWLGRLSPPPYGKRAGAREHPPSRPAGARTSVDR